MANIAELARLLLFPADLVTDYRPGVILPTGVGALRFWVGGGVLLATMGLAVWSLRRSPWITLGVVWVVLSLAVVGNVLFPVGLWVAERTLYLPSVGMSLLAVGLGQYAVGLLREAPPRLHGARDPPHGPRRCTDVDGGAHLARHGDRIHYARRGSPRVLPSSVVDGHATSRRW